MYILDTNTLIYFFKGIGAVSKHLLATPPKEIGIPSIVLFELEVGIAKSSQPQKRKKQLKESSSPTIPTNSPVFQDLKSKIGILIPNNFQLRNAECEEKNREKAPACPQVQAQKERLRSRLRFRIKPQFGLFLILILNLKLDLKGIRLLPAIFSAD